MIASAILLFAAAMQPAASADTHYAVRFDPKQPQSIAVTIEWPDRHAGVRTFVMPRATPTTYSEQRYERFIEDLRAYGEHGEELAVARGAGPRWTLGDAASALTRIEYRIDVARMEQETLDAAASSRIRPAYLSLLAWSVLGYVDGMQQRAIELDVSLPDDWPVLTTLEPSLPLPRGHAHAHARDYFALADSQIAGGPDLDLRRVEATVPTYLASYAESPIDRDAQAKAVSEAMRATLAYFGRAPFSHYVALLEVLKPVSPRHGYGFSQEHLDSGTFYFSDSDEIAAAGVPFDGAQARYNFAHHIVHSWLPRRIYGRGNYPFNWELAPLIDTVWFSEGFGQYVALAALADTMPVAEGAKFRDALLDKRFRQRLEHMPDFIRHMPLVELSRVASDRYSLDFRTGGAVFSRGALMAAEMDDLIRTRSHGKRTLRDAMRHMHDWADKSGRGFEIDELPKLIAEATGLDTRAVMEKWLAPMTP